MNYKDSRALNVYKDEFFLSIYMYTYMYMYVYMYMYTQLHKAVKHIVYITAC